MRPVRARACGLPTKATFVRVQQLQIGYELPALHAQQRSADAWSGSVHGGHGPPSERSAVGDLLVPQQTPHSLCKGEVGRLRCAKPTGWGSRNAEIAAFDPTQLPRLEAGVADFQDR